MFVGMKYKKYLCNKSWYKKLQKSELKKFLLSFWQITKRNKNAFYCFCAKCSSINLPR